MVKWSPVLWTMAALAWAVPVFGQPQDARRIQARKDCLTGRVDAGVALLAELYTETNNPNFIYNQARCYEQNGRAGDAINLFREYLHVAKNATAEEKLDVEQHIRDCQAMQVEQARAAKEALAKPSESTPAAPLPVPAEPAPPVVAPAPAAAPIATTPPPPEPVMAVRTPLPSPPQVEQAATPARSDTSSGSGLRTAGTVGMIAAAAGLVAGAVFSGLVSKTKTQAQNDVNDKRTYDADVWSRGRTYETLQWMCYGTGAALGVAGAVLYWLGYSSRSENSKVSLVPSVGPDQASVLVGGSF